MKAAEFARKIIEGSGGMNQYEDREVVMWHHSDRVAAAIWTLRFLTNPDCEGSDLVIKAILYERAIKLAAKSSLLNQVNERNCYGSG